jgi:CO dehydrogenase/acetyl-CoA synthase delta subunit
MSQRDVERTLGRLLTDVRFRRDFFSDPARACLGLGLQLTAHELEALLRVPARRLAALEGDLDDRIRRFRIGDAEDRDGSEEAATS